MGVTTLENVARRPPKRARAMLALVTGLTVLPHPAQGHEFWLTPSRYRAAAGDTAAIVAFVGTGFRGERKPYATTRSLRFTLRAARTIDLRPATANGDLTFARFVAPDRGGALVGYESDFTSIELPAAEFDRYLALEGLDGPLAARRGAGSAVPGRERYARCPKTWIAGADPSRVTRPIGLTLELVPVQDPSVAGHLSVQVLDHGRPLAGALVRAWNTALGRDGAPRDAALRDSVPPVVARRTDARGIATLDVDHPGEWMLSVVRMIESRDRAQADWESTWASLTFARAPRP